MTYNTQKHSRSSVTPSRSSVTVGAPGVGHLSRLGCRPGAGAPTEAGRDAARWRVRVVTDDLLLWRRTGQDQVRAARCRSSVTVGFGAGQGPARQTEAGRAAAR